MDLPVLIEGRLLRRYKRFLADVELADGSQVVVHCPNPGSMKSMMDEGARVWLSESNNPRRKLAFTWELVLAKGQMTLVHAGRANSVVEEALRAGVIRELTGFSELQAEVPYGAGSRIDFRLRWPERPSSCYVEVKSVTMFDGERRGAFPDSITARGSKHLRELMAIVGNGHRAVLLFCCSRAGMREIRPADEIDRVYGETLRLAAGAGVELLAYGCDVSTEGIVLRESIGIDLR